MKFSFSTKGWHGRSFDDFLDTAEELGFQGIELHNIAGSLFSEKDGAFHSYLAHVTLRKLYEKKLSLPCIDTICDPGDGRLDENLAEIEACVRIAENLHIPYIRIHAKGDSEKAQENARACLASAIELVRGKNITLLVETSGTYLHTARLRQLLDSFACDELAALWDMYSPYFLGGESPEETITNLGAYVRHVHVKDAEKATGAFSLVGEGDMPIDEMMLALRSINYDGFLSLEWDPQWSPELDDIEVIFSHFVNFMSAFADPSRAIPTLYWNEAHTGQFVWKKDLLIDATFSQVLDRMVREFPDQYCFKYTTLDYTRTYSEFRDDVDECARALVAHGVKAGTHVAVWATNVPAWYIAFWATVKLGAVLVTMNTAYKIHEAEYLLKQSDTHTLIMVDGYRDSDYAAIMNELCPEIALKKPEEPLHSRRLPFLRNVVTVGFRMKGCQTWEEMLRDADRVPQEEIVRMASLVDKDDVCNMQYTSGTTGFPKGVMLTHYNVVNNGKYIGDHMDLSTADRMMIQVPMFHCFGMVLSMTASMTHGATMSPLPYFSPKSALACVKQEHITCFNGVPTMFIAMMQHPDFDKKDFSYIRTGIMAGSNCPPELMKKAQEVMNMTQIVSVYGQTEASPGCTMSSYYDSEHIRTETVGTAFANVECKVIDPETGLDVPDGVNGEFVARGYNIMKGYYKMPGATAATIDADGWLHTGDLAARDPDGAYRITGRLKDMIIRGGENIYPREIEEFIYTHPKVRDVQVIGVPDKQYGEEILAAIILKDGESMTEDEMKAYIRSHMARHKVPRYIEFVEEFPMNAAGKILKYKMREDAAKKYGQEN